MEEMSRPWCRLLELQGKNTHQQMGSWSICTSTSSSLQTFNVSRKSIIYQRFVSISSYCICCTSITIVSIDTNLLLVDSISNGFLKFNNFEPMHSTQHITQKRADQGLCTFNPEVRPAFVSCFVKYWPDNSYFLVSFVSYPPMSPNSFECNLLW